ncbi:hypothetical protein WH47_02989 [Habropoda laboriosa]|uniref:Uncharacterized protein n=1 Tax=Habropoda laboriosa TaxID=597456 RepID=A0A0L7QSW6_9HYME|nr:hypothetical protein WH47_02989 [Habropoda laboriosa]
MPETKVSPKVAKKREESVSQWEDLRGEHGKGRRKPIKQTLEIDDRVKSDSSNV